MESCGELTRASRASLSLPFPAWAVSFLPSAERESLAIMDIRSFFVQNPRPSHKGLIAWAQACGLSCQAARRAMAQDLGLPATTPLHIVGDLSVQDNTTTPRHVEVTLPLPVDNNVAQIQAAWARARTRPPGGARWWWPDADAELVESTEDNVLRLRAHLQTGLDPEEYQALLRAASPDDNDPDAETCFLIKAIVEQHEKQEEEETPAPPPRELRLRRRARRGGHTRHPAAAAGGGPRAPPRRPRRRLPRARRRAGGGAPPSTADEERFRVDYGGTRYADLSMSDVTRKGALVIVHVPPAPPPHSIEMENSQQLLEAVLNEYQDPQCICFLSPAACEGNLYRDPGGVSGFGSVTLLVHRARAPYLRIQVEVIELLDGLARAARAPACHLRGRGPPRQPHPGGAARPGRHHHREPPRHPRGAPLHAGALRGGTRGLLRGAHAAPAARRPPLPARGRGPSRSLRHRAPQYIVDSPGLDHLVELTPPPPLPPLRR